MENMKGMTKEIIVWNIQGLNAKKLKLSHLLDYYHPMVCCILETKINPRSKYSYDIGEYKAERKDKEGEIGHGGIAIYLHKNVLRESVPLITELQAMAYKIGIQDRTITIATIYIPETDWQEIEDMEKEIEDLIAQLPRPFILTGDLNAHSTDWYDEKTDQKGRTVDRVVQRTASTIIDRNEPTYFSVAHGTYSHIDLTITSPSLTASLQWETHKDLQGFDHYPVLISMANSDFSYAMSLPR